MLNLGTAFYVVLNYFIILIVRFIRNRKIGKG